MISFRYHIASLVAVLLALAAGVALGAGPLQDEGEPTTQTSSSRQGASGSTRQAAYSDRFLASLQQGLTSGRLQGRSAVLVVLPGAAPDQVTAMTTSLGQAGASLTGTVRVAPDLVDPAKRQLVDELGGQLEGSATKVVLPPGAGSYDRIGSLLAYAIGTKAPGGDPVDQQGKGILAGLSTGELLSTDAELSRRASLVLVLGGAPGADGSVAQGTAGIVLSFVKALDAATAGVVLAGPLAAADPNGVLTAVRSDAAAAKAVSTVDSTEVAAGVIASVLALEEQAGDAAGQYGAGPGATGLRPGAPAR